MNVTRYAVAPATGGHVQVRAGTNPDCAGGFGAVRVVVVAGLGFGLGFGAAGFGFVAAVVRVATVRGRCTDGARFVVAVVARDAAVVVRCAVVDGVDRVVVTRGAAVVVAGGCSGTCPSVVDAGGGASASASERAATSTPDEVERSATT